MLRVLEHLVLSTFDKSVLSGKFCPTTCCQHHPQPPENLISRGTYFRIASPAILHRMELLEERNFFPSLKRNIAKTSSGSQVVSYSSDLGDGKPILVLIHGYPQSAFIWRHIVPILQPRFSLFIPELPGYGISSHPTAKTDYSKRAIGGAILEALVHVWPTIHEIDCRRGVILAGHDRGARICHRLAVDRDYLNAEYGGLNIVATILLDIVPTKVQWDLFGQSPSIAAGYFHWPLLANVELATHMILSMGGGNWAKMALRLAGPNEKARARIEEHGAVDVYAELFDKVETVRGSCEDYKAAAGIDYDQQVEDMKAGRKIGVPTLVMYSAIGIGSKSDVAATWKMWVAEGTVLEAVAVEDGYGHYLPEEAYDIVSDKMLEFLGKHVPY
ncbi:alpha/beta hydrolase [Rhypophila decipiens]